MGTFAGAERFVNQQSDKLCELLHDPETFRHFIGASKFGLETKSDLVAVENFPSPPTMTCIVKHLAVFVHSSCIIHGDLFSRHGGELGVFLIIMNTCCCSAQ